GAVKCILKYFRRTKDLFLLYGGGDLQLRAFTDSSFQSDPDDSKSVSGFVFTLNGGAVSWRSSKQATIADSTTEAEYIATAEAAKEAVWMKKFILHDAIACAQAAEGNMESQVTTQESLILFSLEVHSDPDTMSDIYFFHAQVAAIRTELGDL